MSDESDLLIKNAYSERYHRRYDSQTSDVKLHLDQFVQTDPYPEKNKNSMFGCCIIITILILCILLIAIVVYKYN
jgi:hypothetical protein